VEWALSQLLFITITSYMMTQTAVTVNAWLVGSVIRPRLYATISTNSNIMK